MRTHSGLSEEEVLESASSMRLNVGSREPCRVAAKPSPHLQTNSAPAKVENQKPGLSADCRLSYCLHSCLQRMAAMRAVTAESVQGTQNPVWMAPALQAIFAIAMVRQYSREGPSVQSCVRPHMMISPSIGCFRFRCPRRTLFRQTPVCKPHIRRELGPNHCPAFGTGELQRNGTTL